MPLTNTGLTFLTRFANNSVIVLDGLGSNELQTGLAIFNHLRDLKMEGHEFDCRRIRVGSKEELFGTLDALEAEAQSGLRPILHFEMHGASNRMVIGEGRAEVHWEELVDRLRRIHTASDFNLGVVMSGCSGLHAISPITIHSPVPFHFLLGTQEIVGAGSLRTSMEAFYRGLVCGRNITRAMEGVPSIYKQFHAEEYAAKSYIAYLKGKVPGKQREDRVEHLVGVVAGGRNRAQRRQLKKAAKQFNQPSEAHFKRFVKTILPRGVSFTYQDLLEYVRHSGGEQIQR